MGKATSKTLPAFFAMMGRQSSPGSWRIETVGKRNSHGRRYVGIARLEVQIPGHEDETIGSYIDSLGWQGAGWQKLHGSTGGTRRKVWTRTKILSPNIRYFVANQDLSLFTHFFLEVFFTDVGFFCKF